jgi:hypothetical protein
MTYAAKVEEWRSSYWDKRGDGLPSIFQTGPSPPSI